jgi:MFS family permease
MKMSIETTVAESTGMPYVLPPLGKKFTGTLTLTFSICFVSTLFGGIISMLMPVYLPVVVKDLLGNVPEEKMNDVSAWINCVFIFGWMFGGITWGMVCDKIGRSRSVALSIACFGLCAVLTALSSSWLLVGVYRFLSGFGIGGLLATSAVLVSELWSKKMKAIVLGFVSLAMPVGFFAAGAINNLTEDWRTAFWVGIVPLLLGVIAYFFLPESEKWKAGKHTSGQIFNVQVFSPQHRRNLLIGSVVFGTMLIGLWAVFSWTPTWVQNISKGNAQQQRGLAMMILAAGGIGGSFFSGWIVNFIGLRKTMLLCFAACFIMTFLVFKLSSTVSTLTLVELTILAFFFGISQGALSVYIPSLFAVNICASATGFCFNVGRLFTGTVVFFIGSLVSLMRGYGNAVFIFSATFVIGFIVAFFGKEKNISVVSGLPQSIIKTS